MSVKPIAIEAAAGGLALAFVVMAIRLPASSNEGESFFIGLIGAATVWALARLTLYKFAIKR